MSWDEARTRLQQELDKRLDVAICRIGVTPRVAFSSDQSRPGRFFFSADELPDRIKLLQQQLPQDMQALIQEANEICLHRFKLLGYRDLDYGKEIDWHLDAVHGKRTPLVPWYKINFLDFSTAGDHKVTWELNRHQHLVTLAKAWLLTGEEKYAHEAMAQWHSWRNANPYPLGVNWASSLEVAFRSLSWLWIRHLLAPCPSVPNDFTNDLRCALALNGRHIERYLSTYFSPNTHLLGEAVALFFIGTLCPELSSADRWKKEGWRIVQEEAERQVRGDGVYFEQSLYYHVYALDFFLHARLLASRNGVEVPPALDQVIRKMLTVVQALAQVGPPDGFGDDDGGRLFNPRRNRAEHLTDPLAIGGALSHDLGSNCSASLTEEALWLCGRDAVRESRKGEVGSRFFPDGGLYIVESGSGLSQQMVIDAGPQGTGRSGHGHADALSVNLSFGNRRWLVDAGTFAYITPDNARQSFRGTRAHNTLSVDGLDQANPEGPFAWSALPVTRTECLIAGQTFSLFAGSHSGYERLPEPVRHRRFVFHLHSGFWLVRDVAYGTGVHSLETSWHFASDLEVSSSGNAFVAKPSPDPQALKEMVQLMLHPIQDSRWKCEVSMEQVSPAYGQRVPAPVLRCSITMAVPSEHVMLLVPSACADGTVERFFRLEETTQRTMGSPTVYRFDCAQMSHYMIFGQAENSDWISGVWSSDASFLYCCVRDRRVTHFVCCQASHVRLNGTQVFSSTAPLQYVEWANRNGERRLYMPAEATADTVSESAFETNVLL
jgi:hypothetical protein